MIISRCKSIQMEPEAKRGEMNMNDDVIGAPAGGVDFDRPAMARLTRMALRGRNISEATKETGLSRSMISKLLNQNLKNPPTVNTLRKLNIGNPPELFRQMLIACGYPLDIQDEINAFLRIVEETSAFADVQPDRFAWSSSHALAMVLDNLESKGYGNRFDIDYRADGIFAVDAGTAFPALICVPVIMSEPELKADQVAKLALQGIKKGIELWGLEDTAFLVLTDSPTAYRLLRHLPNRSKIMAVAMASEDGHSFVRQCTIQPTNPQSDDPGLFPLDLSTFGDELTPDA